MFRFPCLVSKCLQFESLRSFCRGWAPVVAPTVADRVRTRIVSCVSRTPDHLGPCRTGMGRSGRLRCHGQRSPLDFVRPLLQNPASPCGEMPEWSNGAVSKTVVPLRVPRVRIPLSPPLASTTHLLKGFHYWRFAVERKPTTSLPGSASVRRQKSDLPPCIRFHWPSLTCSP